MAKSPEQILRQNFVLVRRPDLELDRTTACATANLAEAANHLKMNRFCVLPDQLNL